MPPPVPAQRAQGPPGAASHGRGRRRGEQPGDPGRDQVGHVVEPGGGPAEPLVPGAALADHRVQGVHRAITEQPGQAERGPPEQRGNHRVRGVLGYRLDGRPGQPGRVELRRVAPAQGGQHPPRRGQVAGVQGPAQDQRRATQAGPAQHRPAGQRGGGQGDGRAATGQPLRGQPGPGHRGHAGQHEGRSRGPAVRPQHGLGPGRRGPEGRHRMAPPRVAQHQVEQPARQQPGGPRGSWPRRHHHEPSLPRGNHAPQAVDRRPESPGSRIEAPPGLPTAAAAVAVTGLAPRSQWRDRAGLTPASCPAVGGTQDRRSHRATPVKQPAPQTPASAQVARWFRAGGHG